MSPKPKRVEQDVATNRLPVANSNRHVNSTINLKSECSLRQPVAGLGRSKKLMPRRKRPEKPITFEERTVGQEDLPLPCVHYPGHYGTFIAYSESPTSASKLCSCSRFAIQNYVARQLETEPWPNSDRRQMFVIDSHSFPLSLVDRVMENLVRERFGFRPMGSGSTGESILFQIVKRIFPREPVHRCSRPDFLEGLELDVFLPSRSLAFEFQGQQHYEPVEHWGGSSALEDLRKRDKRKRTLCKKHGIGLIEIRFDDPLTEDHIGAQIETKNRRRRS